MMIKFYLQKNFVFLFMSKFYPQYYNLYDPVYTNELPIDQIYLLHFEGQSINQSVKLLKE